MVLKAFTRLLAKKHVSGNVYYYILIPAKVSSDQAFLDKFKPDDIFAIEIKPDRGEIILRKTRKKYVRGLKKRVWKR